MFYQQIPIRVQGQTAQLFTYILYNSPDIDKSRVRPLIIISPGGGYHFTSDREAEPIAIRFNAMGFHAMVLRYTTPSRFPVPVLQLVSAIRYAREHADECGVDTDKIILCGFSAGGHLTAWAGNHWNHDYVREVLRSDKELLRPNGMILSYPVITSGIFAHEDSFLQLLQEQYEEKKEFMSMEKQVNRDTPPAFLWHTVKDDAVPAENSMLMASALRKQNISFELHLYPNGCHGLALANEETRFSDGGGIQEECQNWIHLAGTWINNL